MSERRPQFSSLFYQRRPNPPADRPGLLLRIESENGKAGASVELSFEEAMQLLREAERMLTATPAPAPLWRRWW